MKKTIIFLIMIIAFMLNGCNSEDVALALDEPPTLKIANGQCEVVAARFGYTWERRTADGKSFVKIADSTDPLATADSLPVISICPVYVSTINPMNAYLMFDIVPDNVTVRCWDTKMYIEDSAETEILDAHREDGAYWPDIILKLKNKNCIYEITAEWTSYEEFGGKATYCFRTDGELIYKDYIDVKK